MRLVAYIRVSSQGQVDNGDSLAGQEESINSWAKNNGHEIIRKYIEAGSSAYRKTYRVQFNNMLRDIKNDSFECDGIIVYQLSRLARNLTSQSKVQSTLDDKDIRLFSVVEPLPEDYDTYKVLGTVIGLMNELQSSQNSRTVCDRLQGTAEKGFFTGGTVPYGYESINLKDESEYRKTLVINDDEAKVVSEIFILSIKGKHGKGWGIKKIASYLNDNKIFYRGDLWKVNTIQRIFNNTIYYGDRVFGKKRVKRPGKINPPSIIVEAPAIITKDVFYQVKDALKSRGLTNNKYKSIRAKSLLTGLVKCGICDSNLTIRTGKGGKYKYYSCGNKIRASVNICTCRHIPKQLLEDAIKDTLTQKIITEDKVGSIIKEVKSLLRTQDTNEKELSKLRRALSKKRTSINAFYEKLLTSDIRIDSTLKDFIEVENIKINRIENEVERIKNVNKLKYKNFGNSQVKFFVKSVIELINSENTEITKSLLISMGLEVTVFPKN